MIPFALVVLILAGALGGVLYHRAPDRKPVVYRQGVRDWAIIPVALLVSAAVGWGLGTAVLHFLLWAAVRVPA